MSDGNDYEVEIMARLDVPDLRENWKSFLDTYDLVATSLDYRFRRFGGSRVATVMVSKFRPIHNPPFFTYEEMKDAMYGALKNNTLGIVGVTVTDMPLTNKDGSLNIRMEQALNNANMGDIAADYIRDRIEDARKAHFMRPVSAIPGDVQHVGEESGQTVHEDLVLTSRQTNRAVPLMHDSPERDGVTR